MLKSPRIKPSVVGVPRMLLIIACAVTAPLATTITSVSNSPDPFDNGSQSTDITVTTSAADEVVIGIWNTAGDTLFRRLFSDVNQSSVLQAWDGKDDIIPAYGTASALPFATYMIRARTNLGMAFDTKVYGSGLIINDSYDLAKDGDGNIYTCETDGILTKIDTTGRVLLRVVIGDVDVSPDPELTGLDIRGIAVDGSYNIFVADAGTTKRIIKVNASSSYTTGVATWNQTAVTNPRGLCCRGDSVWVADNGAGNVKQFDANGNLAGGAARVTQAACTDVCVDGDYYYVCETDGKDDEIFSYAVSDNSSVDSWKISNVKKSLPVSIDAESGVLAVSVVYNDQVWRFPVPAGQSASNLGAEVTNSTGTDTAYTTSPRGVAILGSQIVVLETGNKRMQKFTDLLTVDKIFPVDTTTPIDPADIALDGSGNIFTSCNVLHTIKKYNASGVYVCDIGAYGTGDGQFVNPWGVALDNSGNLYVADYGNGRVQKLVKVSESVYEYNAGSGSWQASVTDPGDMCWGPDERIYVASRGKNSNEILVFDPSSATPVATIAKATIGLGNGDYIQAIAVDYRHNVYVAEESAPEIRKGVPTSATTWNTFATFLMHTEDIRGMATDRFGNLYTTDANGTNLVRAYDLTGDVMATFGTTGSSDGQFDTPTGLAFTGDYSAVWVADRMNDRVEKLLVQYDDTQDDLATIGDPTGPPYVSGITYARTKGDSTLISPVSNIHNDSTNADGDSAVTFVVTFNEAMDTTYAPTVKLKDKDGGFYDMTPRGGTGFNSGWQNTAANVWKGWVKIPSGHDGTATIYVQNARDELGTGQTPEIENSFTLTLDTQCPMPGVDSPEDGSSSLEATISVSGTAEANATVTVSNYDASSGGSLISQQGNVSVDGSGNWTANSISLDLGDNYLTVVAVDGAGNQSVETSPRVKTTRTNVLPGSIALSPAAEVFPGDSGAWTFTYTAASPLNDACFLKIGVPAGWTDPQIDNSSQAGYVTATPGTGTTLDGTSITIVNLDTIQINISSMGDANTFDVQYGGATAAAYAKVTSSASCGTNTFGTFLNDTITVNPKSVYVRGRPLGVYSTDQMPPTTLVGQSDLLVMQLSFDNADGLKTKKVTQVTLQTERSGGVDVAANSRMSTLALKIGGTVYGSVSPGSSPNVVVPLSTPLEIGPGDTMTLDVRANILNDNNLTDSTLQITLVDSTKVNAQEASSATSVVVKRSGAAGFPKTSGVTTFYVPTETTDSLMVKATNLMPATTMGELEQDVGAIRLIFRHPTPGANNIEVTRIVFDLTPANPSTVIERKMLRRKGESTNLYSSTSIESASPLVFNLMLDPLTILAGQSDTIDVLFDIVSNPAASVSFSLGDGDSVVAEDAGSAEAVTVKGDGVSFPMASNTGSISSGTVTPSGKDVDGTSTDWTAGDERLETTSSGEGFYVTWDNANVYFLWTGRDMSINGDLFIYLSTATGGSSTTWSYNGTGTHSLPAEFNDANYCVYYDDPSAKGLRNGASSYAGATFSGSMSASSNDVEIRLPLADIGSPDTLRIIPFVQKEGDARIMASMPDQSVGEFARNPTGHDPQAFVSWLIVPVTVMGATPDALMGIDSSYVVQPKWSYDLGAGNYAAAITPGWECVYISVGGSECKLVCLDTISGGLRWTSNTYNDPPTALGVYYESSSGKDVLFFCEGSNFRAGYDNLNSFTEFWAARSLGGTGGMPYRSIPPDGDGNATVYAYFAASDGKLYKYNAKTGGKQWETADVGAIPGGGVAVSPTKVIVGCESSVRSYLVSGASDQSYTTTDSVKFKPSYSSSLGRVYVPPKSMNLLVLDDNLGLKTSKSMGATITASPFFDIGTGGAYLYCPAGTMIRKVWSDTTTGVAPTIQWTYQATGSIVTNPSSLGNVVYFSSDDMRNFAISTSAGADLTGWPSTVLIGTSKSRAVVDGVMSKVYFGGGDSKVYCYQKQ